MIVGGGGLWWEWPLVGVALLEWDYCTIATLLIKYMYIGLLLYRLKLDLTFWITDKVKTIKFSKDNEEEKVRKLLDLIVQSESPNKWDVFGEVLLDLGKFELL